MINKKPNGMKGIINSSLDPVGQHFFDPKAGGVNSDSVELLALALLNVDYLHGLLQKSFFNDFDYDINDSKWANVTPQQYRDGMMAALAVLEAETIAAREKAENILRVHCGMDPLKLDGEGDASDT